MASQPLADLDQNSHARLALRGTADDQALRNKTLSTAQSLSQFVCHLPQPSDILPLTLLLAQNPDGKRFIYRKMIHSAGVQ